MDFTIKVTNKETFDARVDDVDLTGLKSGHFDRKGDLEAVSGSISIDTTNDGWKTVTGEIGITDYKRDYGFEIIEAKKYDVVFHDDEDSNAMGFNEPYEYCKDWIETGSIHPRGYFEDYIGGVVTITEVATGEVVYTENI